METVWKFELSSEGQPDGPFNVEMPIGSRLLTTQVQRSSVVVWAAVPQPSPGVEQRRFLVLGDGLGPG